MIARRRLLSVPLLVLARAASAGPEISLKRAAAARGMVFGAEALWREIAGDPAFAALLARECAALTPGLEAKWSHLRPAPDRFEFGPLDRMADFAAAHDMALRGHTLLWGPELPPWARAAIADGRAHAILEQHVSTVVARYRGRAAWWDVANEVTDPRWSRGPEGLTLTPWRRAAGPDVVPLAFHLAHAADPEALLFLNDDTLEYEGAEQDEKRATYLRLLEGWLGRGVPIHGFGLQAHLDPTRRIDAAAYRRFLAALAGMGLVLHVTELDVRDRTLPADLAARDRIVADTCRRFLDVALDERALRTVVTWGLSDRFTYQNTDREARRPDGLAARPLPFDAGLAGTAMRGALADAFAGAPAR